VETPLNQKNCCEESIFCSYKKPPDSIAASRDQNNLYANPMSHQSENQDPEANLSSKPDTAKLSENEGSLLTRTIDEQEPEEQSEATQNKLSTWLVQGFNMSVIATFLLVEVAAFTPSADKTFIKEIIPPIISTQGTLLG
jgi:hypothetical protein